MKVIVMGGGTFSHVRPHLALAAPAFGGTARKIYNLIHGSKLTEDAQGGPPSYFSGLKPELWLSRMAQDHRPWVEGGWVTNEDVADDLDNIIKDPETKVIFFSVALCDYHGSVLEVEPTLSGKDQPRLRTSEGQKVMTLTPADKIIGRIRKQRKDIFLVGFKTTAGATQQEQYELGLALLKRTSCNLVFANDVHTRLNMVVVPELGHYYETTNRHEAIEGLVRIASERHDLSFTRTTLVGGPLVPWTSPEVPETLRVVVDHCVARGAYQPFNNVTVGHFGFMSSDGKFTSSRRKQNYHLPEGKDMVVVEFDGDKMIAHGAKPSAGTMSQKVVLEAFFPRFDCIVHGHFPIKPGSKVTVRPQHSYECGSHECGANTLEGMTDFGGVAAVMLEKHGPNIVFHRDAKPHEVIAFIEENFDLSRRTDEFDPA